MEASGQDCGTFPSETTPPSDKTTVTESVEGAVQSQVQTSPSTEDKKPRSTLWLGDTFQKEITKWEEFYDDMKAYLTDGVISSRSQANIRKHANTFSLGQDQRLYYTKTLRGSEAKLKLPVVRSYEERMQVCKAIHVNTGDNYIHHRRDTMLELLGQQYYWKGQRRDVCQCIASCEICSLGLGGKRRSKPPSQKRDIRPPQKLLKVGNSLIPFTSIRTTPHPPSSPSPSSSSPSSSSPQGRKKSRKNTLSTSLLTSSSDTGHTSHSHTLTGITQSNHSHTLTGITQSNHSHTLTGITPSSNHSHTLTGITQSQNHSHTLTGITPSPNHSHTLTGITPSSHTLTGITPSSHHSHTLTGITPSDHSHTLTGITPSSHTLTGITPSSDHSHTLTGIPPSDHSHTIPSVTGSAFIPVEPFTHLYTITDTCVSNASNSSDPSPSSEQLNAPQTNSDMSVATEVTVSDNCGLQIFTTINEPYYEGHDERGGLTTNGQLSHQSSSCVEDSEVESSGDEEYVVQESNSCASMTVEGGLSLEPSIYRLLFQLPSQPNTALCTAVMESMQMSLKHSTDPAQLTQAASQSLVSVFNLSPSTSLALVSPSRAAAYVLCLAAVLMKQDQLCINPCTTLTTSTPPIILHDASCETGSPKVCSSLVGAANWNLGTNTTPMDREMLQMAVSSNRVTAVLHRPFAYPANSAFLDLGAVISICKTRNSDTAVIVDCSGMTESCSLVQLTTALREMVMKGADLIMLPDTGHFQGPPHTCVVIGKTELLSGPCNQLSLLQSQLPLPLLCSAHDTVGSVVAFKSLQVSAFKAAPSNSD